MDQTLAEIYGTLDEQDLEKAAAAELAEELADDEEMDLDGLDEDDIEQLAASVLEDSDEDEDGEEVDDEFVEKVAEADQLGRVMAHAMHQELRGIEKEAGFGSKAVKYLKEGFDFTGTGAARKTHKGLVRVAKKGNKSSNKKLKGISSARSKLEKALKKGTISQKAFDKGMKGHGAAEKKLNTAMKRMGHNKDVAKSGKGLKKRYVKHGIVAGGSALGLAGAGAAAGRMSKEASALDQLAFERAEEILLANGVELEGNEEVNEYDVLASAVEQRAAEILEANGFEVDEE